FSFRFQGGGWTDWSPAGAWTATDLPDTTYRLEARARDAYGNVDFAVAVAEFEIDATPPSPLLRAPAFGEVVSEPIEIRGTTSDPRFDSCTVDVRPEGTDLGSA